MARECKKRAGGAFFCLGSLLTALGVKGGVAGVEVFAVEVVLGDAEGIEETVRVYTTFPRKSK